MTSSGPRPPAAETSLGALGAQEAAPVVIAMWPWVALGLQQGSTPGSYRKPEPLRVSTGVPMCPIGPLKREPARTPLTSPLPTAVRPSDARCHPTEPRPPGFPSDPPPRSIRLARSLHPRRRTFVSPLGPSRPIRAAPGVPVLPLHARAGCVTRLPTSPSAWRCSPLSSSPS